MLKNDRQINISSAGSRTAQMWAAQRLFVSEFYERLRVPMRGTETLAQYLEMKKQRQDELKDVGGFVGGSLEGGRRKVGCVTGRDLITLDMDKIPAGGTDGVHARVASLGCGYCIYSTRKHMAQAPRLRVIVPLDRTATADEYEAVARKLAEIVGFELCDPTTFEPSRLMYWPSCCADSEYFFEFADNQFLSVDGMLGKYADWRDVTSWPNLAGELKKREVTKQGDPTEKHGVIGAFCKTYDVIAAMDKFLPGEYEPATGGRYTYTGGSTACGAVVYEGGKFMFSHHATDPASGKLVNAFDLVRLHKFADLDREAKADTPTNKLPSYAAMTGLATADEAIIALLDGERMKKLSQEFAPVADGIAVDTAWMAKMERNAQGTPAKTLNNFLTIVQHDPNLKGRVRKNLFSDRVEVCGELPWYRSVKSPLWCDADLANLMLYIENLCGKPAHSDVLNAVEVCASNQAYHPVRDYLAALVWDGIERLDTMLVDYLGAEDSAYTRAVTRKAFVAAVARVMSPGIKYDTMLILVGKQGRYKSTLFAKMGGDWFSDSLVTFEGKDAMETIQGKWIIEVAELNALQGSEINAAKGFISKQRDYYRAAYGRYTADRPRQCVFFGTTNARDCLRDTTGGRRFWPIDIDEQERKKDVFTDLEIERDMIWAEAAAKWRVGETLYLPQELESVAGVRQEMHRERSPLEGQICEFVARDICVGWEKMTIQQHQMFYAGGAIMQPPSKRTRVSAVEIWCEMLMKNKADMQQKNAREINRILDGLDGWKSAGAQRIGAEYGHQRCFMLLTDRGKKC